MQGEMFYLAMQALVVVLSGSVCVPALIADHHDRKIRKRKLYMEQDKSSKKPQPTKEIYGKMYI